MGGLQIALGLARVGMVGKAALLILSLIIGHSGWGRGFGLDGYMRRFLWIEGGMMEGWVGCEDVKFWLHGVIEGF